MSIFRKPVTFFILLILAITLKSCTGGSSTSRDSGTGGTSAGYDGTYNCTGSSVTPAGTSSGAGSFSCLNGQCADSLRAFTGTVDANGNFSGTDVLCPTCDPLPMSGRFSKTSSFQINGSSGQVSMTMTCTYGGAPGGTGGGGGGTVTPVITGVTPTSGPPGTSVTIVGDNFPTSSASIVITLCSVPAMITSTTSTRIVFTIPNTSVNPLAGPTCDIIITMGGQTFTTGSPFTVTPLTVPALPPGPNVFWTEGGPAEGFVKTMGITGGPAITVYQGTGTPTAVTVNATGIYWVANTERGPILKTGLAGGDVTNLALSLYFFRSMAMDAIDLYWTDTSLTIDKVGLTGGGSPGQVVSLANPAFIAVDSTNLYWTEYNVSGFVRKRSKTTGVIATLASGQFDPSRIVVDATSVYWIEEGPPNLANGAVKKVLISGGTVTTLASGLSGPTELAVDSTSVYWTEYNGGAVKKVSISGGTVVTLASGLSGPKGIALDTANVYWTEYDGGAVKKVGINGGAVTTLATGLLNPFSIAVYPR